MQEYILIEPTGTYVMNHKIADPSESPDEFRCSDVASAEHFNGLRAVGAALRKMDKNWGCSSSDLTIMPIFKGKTRGPSLK